MHIALFPNSLIYITYFYFHKVNILNFRIIFKKSVQIYCFFLICARFFVILHLICKKCALELAIYDFTA